MKETGETKGRKEELEKGRHERKNFGDRIKQDRHQKVYGRARMDRSGTDNAKST